jgi:predicted RNase H-related nuclease YkuK (DUF458 family)
MDKYFKTETGKIVDIIEYTAQQIKDNPSVKIYIGADSQVYGPKIKFILAIVYRVGNRGGHCIHKLIKTERPPKGIPDEIQVNNRLTEEVYLTMELAQYFIDNSSFKLEAVEFDFNQEESYLSNKLINLSTGWAKGLGFKARTKPDELIACKYADHLVRF